jgi:hypothetical protein
MFAIMFVFFIILLDIAALLYGADSRDNIDSSEWQRRTSYWTLTLNKQSI